MIGKRKKKLRKKKTNKYSYIKLICSALNWVVLKIVFHNPVYKDTRKKNEHKQNESNGTQKQRKTKKIKLPNQIKIEEI